MWMWMDSCVAYTFMLGCTRWTWQHGDGQGVLVGVFMEVPADA